MTCIALMGNIYPYFYGHESSRLLSFWSVVAYIGVSSFLWLLTTYIERRTFFVGRELNGHHRLSISSEFHSHSPYFLFTFTFTYASSSNRRLTLQKSFPLRKSIENYIDTKGYFDPVLLYRDVDILLTTVLLK